MEKKDPVLIFVAQIFSAQTSLLDFFCFASCLIAAGWNQVEDQTGTDKIIFTQSFWEFYNEQPSDS